MFTSSSCGRTVVVGCAVLVVLAVAVLGTEMFRWSPLEREALATTSVGDWQKNKCCVKPAKTGCRYNDMWKCGTAPLVCNKGTPVEDTCSAPTCNDHPSYSAWCDFEDISVEFELCKATGDKSSGDCPSGSERCLYETSKETKSTSACKTSSTLCTNPPQPSSSCQ